VNECKPLPVAPFTVAASAHARYSADGTSAQGLTLAHFTAQFEDLQVTSLTLELNFSTFGPYPRVT
jgi:hypothetical protein